MDYKIRLFFFLEKSKLVESIRIFLFTYLNIPYYISMFFISLLRLGLYISQLFITFFLCKSTLNLVHIKLIVVTTSMHQVGANHAD